MGRPAFTLCRACGKEFLGLRAFDDHRTGSHARNTRRCRPTSGMQAIGQRQDEAGRWSPKAPKRLQQPPDSS